MDTIHWILMAIYWMENSFDGNAKGWLRWNNINIDDMYKDWYHTLGCIKWVFKKKIVQCFIGFQIWIDVCPTDHINMLTCCFLSIICLISFWLVHNMNNCTINKLHHHLFYICVFISVFSFLGCFEYTYFGWYF